MNNTTNTTNNTNTTNTILIISFIIILISIIISSKLDSYENIILLKNNKVVEVNGKKITPRNLTEYEIINSKIYLER